MMISVLVACFAIVLNFAGVTANEPGIPVAFVQRNKDVIVGIHNDFRRSIYAADMQELTWSDLAAYTAEKWAKRCHSHRPSEDSFGENTYLWDTYNEDTSTSEHFMVEAIREWEKEGEEYTYWRRGCGHNHVCNYVQLVAAKTESVGCALVKCPVYFEHQQATKHDVLVFTCFYSPQVDIGQPPYLYGRKCSYCPKGYECNNELCSDTVAQLSKKGQQPNMGKYEAGPKTVDYERGDILPNINTSKQSNEFPPPPEQMTWVDGAPPSKTARGYATVNTDKSSGEYAPPPPEDMTWVDGAPPSGKGKDGSYSATNIDKETPPPENMEFVWGESSSTKEAQNIARRTDSKDQSFPPPPENMTWLEGSQPSEKGGENGSADTVKQNRRRPPSPVGMEFIHGQPPSKQSSGKKTGQFPPPPEDMTWVDGAPPSKGQYRSQNAPESIKTSDSEGGDTKMKTDYIATVYRQAKQRGAGYFRRFPSAYNRQQPTASSQPLIEPSAIARQSEVWKKSPKQESSGGVSEDKGSIPYNVPFPSRLEEPTFPRYSEMKMLSVEFAYSGLDKPAAIEATAGELGSEERHEIYYLTSAHNQFRREKRLEELTWNDHLEKWARYVIRCDIEYPGPINCYSNFDNAEIGSRLETVVYGWTREEDEPISNHCRTPYDRLECNHYSAISDRNIDEFACAALNCGYRRNIVCIYK